MPTRRIIAIAAALALTAAACSSGDDDADGAPSNDDSPATTPAPTLTTTTVTLPEVAPDECDDQPEPADYPDGEVPPAIRPCAVPTELAATTIRDGVGQPAAAGDSVIYDYTRIRSDDGELVDTSYTTGAPASIPVVGRGAEIAGLDQSLVGVRAGQLLRLDIPADLAYGDQPPADAPPTVRPGDALTYIVEVRGVIPVTVPEDAPLDLELEPSVGAVDITTVDLIEGEGRPAELGSTVVVNFLLLRGDNQVVLFNTWEQRSPLVITLDPALMEGPEPATLAGIFEGIQGATPGTRRVITMPPSAAWGPGGQPQLGLPADTDVVVVADLLAVY